MNPFRGDVALEIGEQSFPVRLTLNDVAVVEAHSGCSCHALLQQSLKGELRHVHMVWLLRQLLAEDAFHWAMEQDARLFGEEAFLAGLRNILLEGVLHTQSAPFDFRPHQRQAVMEWSMSLIGFWALSPREWRNLCVAEQSWITAMEQEMLKMQGGTYAA